MWPFLKCFQLVIVTIFCRFFLSGPLIHYFYEFLDKFIPKTASYSKAKRLLIDRGVMSPALLLVFFYVVAILEVSGSANSFLWICKNVIIIITFLFVCWLVCVIFLTDMILSHSRENHMKEQLEKLVNTTGLHWRWVGECGLYFSSSI